MVLHTKRYEDKVVLCSLYVKESRVIKMCWSERCCYVVPANLGCVLVGTISFMLSLFGLATSIALFIMENKQSLQLSAHFAKTFGLDLNVASVHIILSITIIVTLLWMLFSAMLVIGVTQNKPNFVLSYFSFGIIVTIICQLSALLVLLQNSWILALVLFISSLLHIHVLVVVHTVYELMSRGKDFTFRQREDDEDLLADCFDGDLSRV